MSEFDCDLCDKTFEKTESEFDIAKKFLSQYPEYKNETVATLCAECYVKAHAYFASLTKDQIKQLIREYNREKVRKYR